jgi:exodeoxyribonuclease-5
VNDEQHQICEQLKNFYLQTRNRKKCEHISVGGYAGTGKTYMISNFRDYISAPRIAYISYTGKAASVLKLKLEQAGTLLNKDICSTIHRLIYYPKEEKQKIKVGKKTIIIKKTIWVLKRTLDDVCDLIIIDEASMIPHNIWNHLSSFRKPIIVVGDHGQLPPVETNPKYRDFSLMKSPELLLTEIHRTARDSPILRAATEVRKNGGLKYFNDKDACKIKWTEAKDLFYRIPFENKKNIMLCYDNYKRTNLNNEVRRHLKFDKFINKGERLICLKNNADTFIMNGQLGTIEGMNKPPKYNVPIREVVLDMDDNEDEYSTLMDEYCFGNPKPDMAASAINGRYYKYSKHFTKNKCNWVDFFDYGYCTTIHKSQGSEWDVVVVWDPYESASGDLYKRLLYTAITRAKKKVMVIT